MSTKLVLTIAVDGTPVVTGKTLVDDSAVRLYSKEEFQGILDKVAKMFMGNSKATKEASLEIENIPKADLPEHPDRSKPVSVLKKTAKKKTGKAK